MNPLWKDTLVSLVRRLLTFAAGYLMANGLIDNDLGNRIITEGSIEIASAIILFGGVTWASNRSKVKSWFETVTAHQADPGTSLQEVLEKSSKTPVDVKKKTVERELTAEALDEPIK